MLKKHSQKPLKQIQISQMILWTWIVLLIKSSSTLPPGCCLQYPYLTSNHPQPLLWKRRGFPSCSQLFPPLFQRGGLRGWFRKRSRNFQTYKPGWSSYLMNLLTLSELERDTNSFSKTFNGYKKCNLDPIPASQDWNNFKVSNKECFVQS